MNSQKIFMTGATGFIGHHLYTMLSNNGFTCTALVRDEQAARTMGIPTTSIMTGSLETLPSSSSFPKGFDTIIHLAARVHHMRDSGPSLLETYRTSNCDSTLRLAETGLAAGIRNFIFFSTVKVMGDFDTTDGILSETDLPRPSDSYGISKFEAEEGLKKLFIKHQEAHCIILRLPMVYGPGNKGNMLTLLRAAKSKIPLPLKNARGKRSMIYVENICDAVLTILRKDNLPCKSCEIFNLTDAVDYTSNELYSGIFQFMNKKNGTFAIPSFFFFFLSFVHPKLKAIISRLFNEYRFSSNLFQKTFHWQPKVSLQDGIAKTVQWFKTSCT